MLLTNETLNVNILFTRRYYMSVRSVAVVYSNDSSSSIAIKKNRAGGDLDWLHTSRLRKDSRQSGQTLGKMIEKEIV